MSLKKKIFLPRNNFRTLQEENILNTFIFVVLFNLYGYGYEVL